MPLVRFKVRNEFGLGRPELYGNGTLEDEDPKALLGGVTVAGLVGLLRQLGDLAEFAAEVFHGIQEQVTVTASRSQKLTSRVRRIESALSPLEKAVLSQTSHIHYAYTAGREWHPRTQNGQNHFIYNDLPLFVMQSYEQCRDPPRLHLLDRFDIGGSGSCLRRYSDPTLFRKELSDPIETNDTKVQRDKSYRKSKKKRLSQRKIPRSRLVSTSEETSGTRPSSLTDERQTTSQSTSTVGMACTSNMQELFEVVGQPYPREQSDAQEQPEEQEQSGLLEPSKTHDSRYDSGYIEYLIHQSPMSEPKEKLSEEFLPSSPQHADSICSALAEGSTVVDDNIQYSPSVEQLSPCAPSDVWDEKKETSESLFEQKIEDEEASEIHESIFGPGTPDKGTQHQRSFDRMDILVDEVDTVEQVPCRRQLSKIDTIPQCESEGENQIEHGSETESRSEVDEYVDARNTIESESDNDLEGQPTQKLECYLRDVNTHSSEEVSKDNNDKSAEISRYTEVATEHMAQDPEHDHSEDESCSVSDFHEGEEASDSLSVPAPGETVFRDNKFQEPGESVATLCSSLAEAGHAGMIVREESVATYLLSAETFPDERMSPEESMAMFPSLAEAVPHKNNLPEELVATSPFLAEAFPDESPEELVATSPFLAEAFPDESPEEPVATDQSLAKAIPEEKLSLEEPVATYPLSAEAFPDQRISLEESIAKPASLAEAVPPKKISPEEPVSMDLLLAEAFPDESPEEPVAMDPPLAKVFPHGKFSVEEPVPTYPLSAEAFPDESISPEEPTTYQPLAEAVPHKKVSLEEPVAMDPLWAEAIPDESISLEDPVVVDLSLAKAIPHEKISLEESVTTYASLAEAVPDVKNSSEKHDATYPSLAETVPDGKILPETPDATCCPDGHHATDEAHTASDGSTKKKTICDVPKSRSTERILDKTIAQVSGHDLAVFDPRASSDVDDNLNGESLAPFCSPSISGNMVLDANFPLRGGIVKSCPEARESLSNDVCVESVTIWSNGSLLGLEPSKPPVFAVPNSVNGDMKNENNSDVSVKASGKKEPSDEPVENNKKASDPSSQHSSGESYSIGSDQQSTATSFGVFGLSHRLLMNGFRRNLSACNYESLPASSNTEVATEDEIEHGYQVTRGSTFDEPFGSGSLFDSPTSSPPLEHMTISFSPMQGFAFSKLKLKIPSQAQYHERGVDMFPSFQLVPETASPHNNATESDDDDDTFCRSSPCISMSCCSEHSRSDSEMWESDGNTERKDGNLYDALCRISPGDSVSSFDQVRDKNTFAGIGVEPCLSGSSLDFPCFDAVNTSHAIRETQVFSNGDIHEKLPSHIESAELLGSSEQDTIPEPSSCGSGDQPHHLPDSLEHESCLKIPESTSSIEPPVGSTVDGKQFGGEAAASPSEAKQSDPRRNSIAFSHPTKANTSVIHQAVATDDEDN